VRVGSLFAGIGGFDLAAQRVGWTTVWYSEIHPYASAVMAHRFPEAVNLGDVTQITNPPAVDVLCGGFPCQDISLAGKGGGVAAGARSGLWREFARLIAAVRPSWVVAENVPALRTRGLDIVLRDLDALGYVGEWHCIPAAAVGAPHRRDRIWIVAHAAGQPEREPHDEADAVASSRDAWLESGERRAGLALAVAGTPLADAGRQSDGQADSPTGAERDGGQSRDHVGRSGRGQHAGAAHVHMADPRRERTQVPPRGQYPTESILGRYRAARGLGDGAGAWAAEPAVGRVVDGVSARVDRLTCLGNAIVPQIAQMIFEAIAAHAHKEVPRAA
jgi:DNA (cytosine-5)-methyltransferase 1